MAVGMYVATAMNQVDGAIVDGPFVIAGATVGLTVSRNVGADVRIRVLSEFFLHVGMGVIIKENVGTGVSLGRPLDDLVSAPLLLNPLIFYLLPPFPLERIRLPLP